MKEFNKVIKLIINVTVVNTIPDIWFESFMGMILSQGVFQSVEGFKTFTIYISLYQVRLFFTKKRNSWDF